MHNFTTMFTLNLSLINETVILTGKRQGKGEATARQHTNLFIQASLLLVCERHDADIVAHRFSFDSAGQEGSSEVDSSGCHACRRHL